MGSEKEGFFLTTSCKTCILYLQSYASPGIKHIIKNLEGAKRKIKNGCGQTFTSSFDCFVVKCWEGRDGVRRCLLKRWATVPGGCQEEHLCSFTSWKPVICQASLKKPGAAQTTIVATCSPRARLCVLKSQKFHLYLSVYLLIFDDITILFNYSILSWNRVHRKKIQIRQYNIFLEKLKGGKEIKEVEGKAGYCGTLKADEFILVWAFVAYNFFRYIKKWISIPPQPPQIHTK